MYNNITIHDLEIRIQYINEFCNTQYMLEYWPNVINPYRMVNCQGMGVIHSGTKKELYRYLIGVLEGINTYKRAHNV